MQNKISTVTPHPAHDAIKAARAAAGLTQTTAARLICSTLRTWQQWEAADRRMHPALFELFLLKCHMRADPQIKAAAENPWQAWVVSDKWRLPPYF